MKTNHPPLQFTAFRCPDDLRRALEIQAQKEHRTLSNYILTLVAEDIARRELASGTHLEEPATPYLSSGKRARTPA